MPGRVKKNSFNPYSQPAYPIKPQEFLATHERVGYVTIREYPAVEDIEKLRDFLNQYRDYNITVDVDHHAYEDYGGGTYCDLEGITFSAYSDGQAPNPHYQQQLAEYEKKRAEVREARKLWKLEKKAWEEEEAEKKRQAELKMLRALQRKYKDDLSS